MGWLRVQYRLSSRGEVPLAYVGLDTAQVSAVTLRAVVVNRDVPDLSCSPLRPTENLAVNDDTPADAGPPDHKQEIFVARARAKSRLTHRGNIRVILDEHREWIHL